MPSSDDSKISKLIENLDDGLNITPWSAETTNNTSEMTTFNYDHVITKFGCQKITHENLEAFEKIIKKPVHRLLRRNLGFAHRDLDKFLECIEKKEKFYLYTGRGPSSQSMHLGHAIPFVFCKYMQDTFQVPIVIQMTDDEKFLCKDISLENCRKFATENIKDIIAFGFDPKLTYIFSNYESSHLFMENTLKISKSINLNEAMKVFGFDFNTNIGMIDFPAKQIAAGFSTSFSFLPKNMLCLIPCAIDQDPYFRLARDKAVSIKERKPASIYFSLLPDLQGTNRKMSASDPRSSIFLNDSMKDIETKINKFAFSGGQETLELHRKIGGRTNVDVAYQYLRYFLEDDETLEMIRTNYEDGSMLSGEMKKTCIECIQGFVRSYQEVRTKITDEDVANFKDIDRLCRDRL